MAAGPRSPRIRQRRREAGPSISPCAHCWSCDSGALGLARVATATATAPPRLRQATLLLDFGLVDAGFLRRSSGDLGRLGQPAPPVARLAAA
jgi:hypothetical protein